VKLIEERQLRLEERSFTIEEALKAKEAFITSASLFVQSVVKIDGKAVADGKVGPMARRLREIYIEFARATSS
jgi:D-alanine transaminase